MLDNRMHDEKPAQAADDDKLYSLGDVLVRLVRRVRPPYPPLREWLLQPFSIAEGSVILMLAFLFSAALGVVRQILLNAQFGLSAPADAYNAAFRLPETLATMLAGGTLANALIPVLLAVVYTQGQQAAERFLSLVLNVLLLVVVSIVLVAVFATPWFVTHILVPGFDAPTLQLTINLTRLLLLELIIVVMFSVANAVLISRNQFLLPALSIAFQNLTIIAGIIAAMLFPEIGVYGPAVGSLGDAALQLLILLPGLWWQGIRYQPVWSLDNRDLHEVVRLLIPNGLSSVANYAGGIIDNRFASLTRETGNISALTNAFLLFGLPVRLFGVAIGQAAFPRFAVYVVNEDWPRLRRTMVQALSVALGLSVAVLIGLLVLGRWLISLLFERGAFDVAAGDLTFTLLVAYIAALPAAIGTEIVTRSLIAMHDTRTPLIINLLQLTGRLVSIPLLLPALGVLAIPVAFAATSTLETLGLAGAFFYKLRRRQRAT